MSKYPIVNLNYPIVILKFINRNKNI